jgi:hypothetical protein
MSLLDFIYVSGFAGFLMLFAWIHYIRLPIGGTFSRGAIPWLIAVAVFWPCCSGLFLVVVGLGMYFEQKAELRKALKEEERKKLVAAGKSKSPYMPPYDGSQKRARFWKKVTVVDGTVKLKRKPRWPRSRT